jgi:hypothetical protein
MPAGELLVVKEQDSYRKQQNIVECMPLTDVNHLMLHNGAVSGRKD